MHVAATLRKPRRADDGERWYKGTLTEQQGAYTKIWHVEGYTPVLGIKPCGRSATPNLQKTLVETPKN